MISYVVSFLVLTKYIATALALILMAEAVWKQLLYSIQLKLKWNGKVFYDARRTLFQKVILMQFLTAYALCGAVYMLEKVEIFFRR